MRQMASIYWRAFKLYHRRYLPKVIGWFLLGVLQTPVYILMVLRFEDLFHGVEPVRNGIIVIGLATVGYILHLIVSINLFQTAMVSPTCDLQVGIFKHFLRLPPRRYPEVSSGDLTNILFSQIAGGWFLQGIVSSGYFLIRAVGLILVVAWISLPLALVSTIPILMLSLIPRTLGKTFVRALADWSKANSRFESAITDTLNGILTVKLFDAAAFHVRRIRELARLQNLRWLKSDFLMVGVNSLTLGITPLAIPLFLITGSYLAAQGVISLAQLVPLFLVVNLANQSLVMVGTLMGYALNYGGQLNNILKFLENEVEGEEQFPFKHGKMDMERVAFSYRSEQPILEDFALTIPPGEKIAIVGPSGIGKSTIFALLRGMQFPQRGQVRVDGTPVSQENAPSLREQIASVSQAAYMFDADLAFNLTLGRERSKAEIQNALQVVGLEEFVAGLPERMDTRFGPGGFAISGGEKARVCLARALLLERPVLLLDEVTANIDSIREEEILEKVLHGMEDKSVVVISHRLSSVRNFPRIVFLEEGRIRGEGTHQELLASCLRYKEMFGEQVG